MKARKARRARTASALNEIAVASTVRAAASAGTVRDVALRVLDGEKQRGASISITFVGPARMRTLNRTYLGHDYVTDVISFAFHAPTSRSSRPSPSVVGDVYICPAEAAKAARRFETSAKEETRRLVVHGVLHVLGYEHPETGDRTASAMWKKQEAYLVNGGSRT